MSSLSTPNRVFWLVAPLVAWCIPSMAEEIWTVREGDVSIELDAAALVDLGLLVEPVGLAVPPASSFDVIDDVVAPGSDLVFAAESGSVVGMLGRQLKLAQGLRIVSQSGAVEVMEIAISEDEGAGRPTEHTAAPRGPFLELRRIKYGMDPYHETFVVYAPEMIISPALAEMLGDEKLVGASIGSVTATIDGEWIGGDDPVLPDGGWLDPTTNVAVADGPDVTFCQLYGLIQYGRVGDIVGLAVATTSWNVGTQQLLWYGSPNVSHPFIIMNLFRLKDEKFEQIGQSWIKHGFCALDNTQCGGSCSPTGCNTLNVGCTDTYSSYLNAVQSGLAPRDEVNPWTGEWSYQGSHFQTGGGHNAISHRLQVHDADLDPAQNPGATYYAESFYACLDDVNVWNSAAWKQVTPVGSPGGSWSFSMTGPSTPPEIGFAIDAWIAGRQTEVAQEVPCVEFVSPDGRCVLSTGTFDLGGGMWRYEYALLNIDMDRKVDSFSVPLLPGSVVTNVGFHAVESHDEPAYDNSPWTATITDSAITWSTTSNPIRWGTLYNFRFDTDSPPVTSHMEVGLYEPGLPDTLEFDATGPDATVILDCNGNGIADECDIDCGPPGGPCDAPGCGLSDDCNGNGVPTDCDLASGASLDCDGGPLGSFVGGGSLFSTFCAGCHGPNGSGGFAPDIRDTGRRTLWDVLAEATTHPGGAHPEFTPQDFADIEAFLATGGSLGRPDLLPDDCQSLGDCDGDGSTDGCELEAGTQFDADYDGFPDECVRIDAPLPDVVGKNRYISFSPVNRIVQQAVRVTAFAMPVDFAAIENTFKWVGPPDPAGIARLVCEPHYQVWTEPFVHVGDQEIVPNAAYEVQVILEGEDTANEAMYSAPPTAVTTCPVWGDLVGAYVNGAYEPPNGVANLQDAQAVVKNWQGNTSAAPLTWLDIVPEVPNAVVNLVDAQRVVKCWQSVPYPFACPAPCP